MQGTAVRHTGTGRTGVVTSGIPFRVGNRKYVGVRYDDTGEHANVGVWLLRRTR
jgi:hypothetical protein